MKKAQVFVACGPLPAPRQNQPVNPGERGGEWRVRGSVAQLELVNVRSAAEY